MGIDLINSIWPEWKTVRELGQGSYGSVFEVVRDDGRLQTRGAVKIITIPHDEGTVKSLVAEGMTLQDTNEYFRSIIDDFVKEIDIMESFKGVQNIVSIEDYKVV